MSANIILEMNIMTTHIETATREIRITLNRLKEPGTVDIEVIEHYSVISAHLEQALTELLHADAKVKNLFT